MKVESNPGDLRFPGIVSSYPPPSIFLIAKSQGKFSCEAIITASCFIIFRSKFAHQFTAVLPTLEHVESLLYTRIFPWLGQILILCYSSLNLEGVIAIPHHVCSTLSICTSCALYFSALYPHAHEQHHSSRDSRFWAGLAISSVFISQVTTAILRGQLSYNFDWEPLVMIC